MMYDVVIIGAGPAGLSAGIFTTRAGLKTICFEKLAVGGQAALSYEIANYPGFINISGFELSNKMKEHAEANGLEIEYANVSKLTQKKNVFEIETRDNVYKAKKVIIANGCKVRKLGLKNEEKLTGRGVSYCASCDGGFFKNKVVAVVGGGNTAMENVNYLANIAKKVYLINRSENFRAGEVELERVKKLKNVEIITSAMVEEINGEQQLEKVVIKHNEGCNELKIDGLFIAIGYEPDLSFLNVSVELDGAGYIVVDKNQETSVKNIYACGDTTSKHFKQVISACAEGAVAGNSCVGG